MDEPRGHYAKKSKFEKNKYQYYMISLIYAINKQYKQTKQRLIDTENRLMGVRWEGH